MIVLTALFCAFQFQSDEPANGRFKLNQWQYLYHYKMSQTTSELSSISKSMGRRWRRDQVTILSGGLKNVRKWAVSLRNIPKLDSK